MYIPVSPHPIIDTIICTLVVLTLHIVVIKRRREKEARELQFGSPRVLVSLLIVGMLGCVLYPVMDFSRHQIMEHNVLTRHNKGNHGIRLTGVKYLGESKGNACDGKSGRSVFRLTYHPTLGLVGQPVLPYTYETYFMLSGEPTDESYFLISGVPINQNECLISR